LVPDATGPEGSAKAIRRFAGLAQGTASGAYPNAIRDASPISLVHGNWNLEQPRTIAYPEGAGAIAAKVVDIFGNDTMTIVDVSVGKNGGKK
jgi:hypothetical protein